MVETTPPQLQFPIPNLNSRFSSISLIGSGAYGSVYKAYDNQMKAIVAVKVYQKITTSPLRCKRALREIEIMFLLKHPYIIYPYELFWDKDSQNLVITMEYAQCDLRSVLKSPIVFSPLQIKKIMYSIIKAINYLHSRRIVHRDLKPSNILIGLDNNIRICDFGLSRSISNLPSDDVDFDKYMRFHHSIDVSSESGNKPCKTANEMNEVPSEFQFEIPPVPYKEIKFDEPLKENGSLSKTTSKSTKKSSKAGNKKNYHKGPKIDITSNFKALTINEKKSQQRILLQNKAIKLSKITNRQLTGYIGTRWYRAPEVILMEKLYATPIDIWSIGCIFAELLQMGSNNPESFINRRPLFPGASCFPLSPNTQTRNTIANLPSSPRDQMNIILQILGTPKTSEIEKSVHDAKALEYMLGFPTYLGYGLKAMIPTNDSSALDLLQKMLTFNPYERITIHEILKHKYFKGISELEQNEGGSTKIDESKEDDPLNLFSDAEEFNEMNTYMENVLNKLLNFIKTT